MELSAFKYGANAVGFIKNGKKYGMICVWAMQADYDKILMLLGAQSITGKNIRKGDIIGVSALNENQQDIVDALGLNHSDDTDKEIYDNITYKSCFLTVHHLDMHPCDVRKIKMVTGLPLGT
jgi:hypothetical protein